MLDPHTLKADFPILQQQINGHDFAYLDSAATSQKPQSVLDTLNAYYREYNANVHRGLYQISEKATSMYEHARGTVAQYIHASPEEIIVERGATEGINHAARLLEQNVLKTGDTIVVSVTEHHSNIVPWQLISKKNGYRLEFLDVDPEGRFDLAQYQKLLQAGVKVVALQHVSNVTGVIHPLESMIAQAHQNGALTVIDASQSVPHMAVDVQKLNCDFLAFSGHKMLAPTGIGILYGKREHLEKFEPVFGGGDMILEVRKEYSTWNDLPWKFEPGTPPIAGLIGLAAAIDYLQKVGIDHIEQHEKELTRYTIRELGQIEDLRILGPSDDSNRIGAVSFTLGEIHPHDIAAILDQYGVAVRAGHHCAQILHRHFGVNASARASLYLYNTKQDIDQLVGGLKEVVKKLER